MKEIKPILRAVRYKILDQSAFFRVRLFPIIKSQPPQNCNFIVGCGRSGTTILGNLLGEHPDIHYFHEPYHLWVNIDQRTDVTNLHRITAAHYFMDQDHYSIQAKTRFDRLFIGGFNNQNRTIIEKTPHNIARLGYLDALCPDARYVHIIRNGVDVARSIEQAASENWYKIACKPNYNQWWGTNNSRWTALAYGGKARNYFPDEVGLLEDNLQKAAYEWLVSLGEADRWRNRLGNRLFEVTYTEFTQSPKDIFNQLCHFLKINCSKEWLDTVSTKLHAEFHHVGKPIQLPAKMCIAFNAYQARYGFEERAVISTVEI